jgi:hypothetical protein
VPVEPTYGCGVGGTWRVALTQRVQLFHRRRRLETFVLRGKTADILKLYKCIMGDFLQSKGI